MKKNRLLVVDDNEDLRSMFQEGLSSHGFDVVLASNVNDALKLISSEQFDALLTDLHMPEAGDGFTVVSAMRHAHPGAVTVVYSGYPALEDAMSAILLQADEVLAKPVGLAQIVDLLKRKLEKPSAHQETKKERVAAILERDAHLTIEHWLSRVEGDAELSAITLDHEERTGHLPLLLSDLVNRLRLSGNDKVSLSSAARLHGTLRCAQGYTIPMMVQESRLLQVSIFKTLQDNLKSVDFSTVLLDVMTIADEVDAQLKQAVLGFSDSPTAKTASQPA